MDPGKTIQNFRKLHGLKQSDIATFMFVHPATIGCWERGQSQITAANFEKVLNFLGYELVIQQKKESVQKGADNETEVF